MDKDVLIPLITLSLLSGLLLYAILRYRICPLHSQNSQNKTDESKCEGQNPNPAFLFEFTQKVGKEIQKTSNRPPTDVSKIGKVNSETEDDKWEWQLRIRHYPTSDCSKSSPSDCNTSVCGGQPKGNDTVVW